MTKIQVTAADRSMEKDIKQNSETWKKTLKQNAEKRYDFRFIERRKRK